MFKTLFIAAVTTVSVSAFSATQIELSARMLRQECTIKDGVVSKVLRLGKDRDVTLSTSHEAKIEGIEKYVDTAIARTVSTTGPEAGFSFKVTKDGSTHEIFQQDSEEALLLIQLMVQACK